MTGPCAHCGRTVTRRYGPVQARRLSGSGILYCDRDCQAAHRASLVEYVTLTCDRCGKQFRRPSGRAAQRSKRSTYCSEACRLARVRRTCEVCGNAFTVTASEAEVRPYRFCSRACFFEGTASQWSSHREYLRHKRSEDPDRFRAYVRNRRARKKAADGEHTAEEFRAKLERYGGRCHWCRRPIRGTPHADHLIPLSRGGSNDISNIVPACAKCNLTKSAKMPWEFQEGRLL